MSDTTSVERAFAILETFEREKRSLTLKELSEYCDIPASTCHSLVHTLLRRAYLYQAGRRKELYPTRRLYDMGSAILAHDEVLRRLLPSMEELRDATHETVILGKRRKDDIVYLEVLESPEVIRYSARPGDTKPLHSTCIGKCMLAAMPPQDVADWLKEHPASQITDNTITDAQELIADLELGRQQGFFATRGENVADVTALAVPVLLNNELYGLAVAGPSHRIDKHFDALTRELTNTLDQLLEQDIAAHG